VQPSTDKFLEFRLPSGAGGMAAGYTRKSILDKVKQFCNQHCIEFTHKTVSYTLQVRFDDDKYYTFFMLSWDPDIPWHRPTLK